MSQNNWPEVRAAILNQKEITKDAREAQFSFRVTDSKRNKVYTCNSMEKALARASKDSFFPRGSGIWIDGIVLEWEVTKENDFIPFSILTFDWANDFACRLSSEIKF